MCGFRLDFNDHLPGVKFDPLGHILNSRQRFIAESLCPLQSRKFQMELGFCLNYLSFKKIHFVLLEANTVMADALPAMNWDACEFQLRLGRLVDSGPPMAETRNTTEVATAVWVSRIEDQRALSFRPANRPSLIIFPSRDAQRVPVPRTWGNATVKSLPS
jgi:hypothetical protein